jgi:hypothetical protein
MLVQHALGITGRSAGIAEADGLALVAVDPCVIAVFGVDPLPETGLAGIRIETDVMLDRRPLGLHPLDDRREGPVIEQDAVFSVIGDIFELIVKQAWVDGMEHAAHSGRAIPGDQVMRVVHAHCRDAVAAIDPEPFKRLRQLASVARDLAPTGSSRFATSPSSHDFAVAMLPFGMIDQARDTQGPVLHRSKLHRSLLPSHHQCDGRP